MHVYELLALVPRPFHQFHLHRVHLGNGVITHIRQRRCSNGSAASICRGNQTKVGVHNLEMCAMLEIMLSCNFEKKSFQGDRFLQPVGNLVVDPASGVRQA